MIDDDDDDIATLAWVETLVRGSRVLVEAQPGLFVVAFVLERRGAGRRCELTLDVDNRITPLRLTVVSRFLRPWNLAAALPMAAPLSKSMGLGIGAEGGICFFVSLLPAFSALVGVSDFLDRRELTRSIQRLAGGYHAAPFCTALSALWWELLSGSQASVQSAARCFLVAAQAVRGGAGASTFSSFFYAAGRSAHHCAAEFLTLLRSTVTAELGDSCALPRLMGATSYLSQPTCVKCRVRSGVRADPASAIMWVCRRVTTLRSRPAPPFRRLAALLAPPHRAPSLAMPPLPALQCSNCAAHRVPRGGSVQSHRDCVS